jgi:hypothetical protein
MSAVEVCPICDIAGCRHIRERQNPAVLAADPMVKAMIGAAYVAASKATAERGGMVIVGMDEDIRRKVLALTPADAATALSDMLREARNEGLEQAANLPCAIIPYSPENKAALDAVTAYREAIRALKEPTE